MKHEKGEEQRKLLDLQWVEEFLSPRGCELTDRNWLLENDLGDVEIKKGLQLLAVIRSRAFPWSERLSSVKEPWG